jgi:hypothetical protein
MLVNKSELIEAESSISKIHPYSSSQEGGKNSKSLDRIVGGMHWTESHDL